MLAELDLIKKVTFRDGSQSLLSRFNKLPFMEFNPEKLESDGPYTFWNDITEKINKTNLERNEKGLYNLHWYQAQELPSSLNI